MKETSKRHVPNDRIKPPSTPRCSLLLESPSVGVNMSQGMVISEGRRRRAEDEAGRAQPFRSASVENTWCKEMCNRSSTQKLI